MSELARPGLALRLAEAMIFASAEPVGQRALLELLDSQQALEGNGVAALQRVLDALVLRYAQSGVQPVQVAGGWQFRTAPDLAPCLTRIVQKPRRLGRAAMETLSVIAYHQPCTRTEIEDIRGVALAQASLDSLLEASLIAPCGRKEVPGRPVLWSTTTAFLRHFGLRELSDLPRREELLLEPTVPTIPEAC